MRGTSSDPSLSRLLFLALICSTSLILAAGSDSSDSPRTPRPPIRNTLHESQMATRLQPLPHPGDASPSSSAGPSSPHDPFSLTGLHTHQNPFSTRPQSPTGSDRTTSFSAPQTNALSSAGPSSHPISRQGSWIMGTDHSISSHGGGEQTVNAAEYLAQNQARLQHDQRSQFDSATSHQEAIERQRSDMMAALDSAHSPLSAGWWDQPFARSDDTDHGSRASSPARSAVGRSGSRQRAGSQQGSEVGNSASSNSHEGRPRSPVARQPTSHTPASQPSTPTSSDHSVGSSIPAAGDHSNRTLRRSQSVAFDSPNHPRSVQVRHDPSTGLTDLIQGGVSLGRSAAPTHPLQRQGSTGANAHATQSTRHQSRRSSPRSGSSGGAGPSSPSGNHPPAIHTGSTIPASWGRSAAHTPTTPAASHSRRSSTASGGSGGTAQGSTRGEGSVRGGTQATNSSTGQGTHSRGNSAGGSGTHTSASPRSERGVGGALSRMFGGCTGGRCGHSPHVIP